MLYAKVARDRRWYSNLKSKAVSAFKGLILQLGEIISFFLFLRQPQDSERLRSPKITSVGQMARPRDSSQMAVQCVHEAQTQDTLWGLEAFRMKWQVRYWVLVIIYLIRRKSLWFSSHPKYVSCQEACWTWARVGCEWGRIDKVCGGERGGEGWCLIFWQFLPFSNFQIGSGTARLGEEERWQGKAMIH